MTTYSFTHTVDLGILGEHEAEVTYEATRGYPATYWEPATADEFEVTEILLTNLPAPGLTWDISPLLSDDELEAVTDACERHAYDNAFEESVCAAASRAQAARDAEDFS